MRNRVVFPASLLIVALLALAGCASNDVSTDYDVNANFSSYHTYRWLDERSGVGKEFDPLLAKRVQTAIEQGLAKRLFSAAGEGQQPDFLVRYYVSSDPQVSEPRARGSVGLGSFGGNVGMGVSLGFPLGGTVVEQRAQLLIDFLNPATQELTWRGSKLITLRGTDPGEITAQVEQAVGDILARFPPKPE